MIDVHANAAAADDDDDDDDGGYTFYLLYYGYETGYEIRRSTVCWGSTHWQPLSIHPTPNNLSSRSRL